MILKHPENKNRVSLRGAVQINHSSYFVCADDAGKTFLEAGKDERIQKTILESMVERNPIIRQLLKKYKIKLAIDTKTLKKLAYGHMNETCNVAVGVYSFLPKHLQKNIDVSALKEASMLHDLGKVLIPSKILNKPAKLNFHEREIMNIHSTLGYELLRTQNLSSNTLELVKYHHQNLKHSGYPAWECYDFNSNVGVQIISISDKYSALREARVYRKRLSRIDSLLILYKEVREGKILPAVYDALVEYAKEFDN